MPSKGVLIIISGPSGVGKGSICHMLMARNPNLFYSVSATTRAPREGEVDGENYHFLTKAQFEARIAEGDFLEWAELFGNYYGTPKSAVLQMLASGKDVILEIDTQGAMQVKAAYPMGIFIFILPPSLEALEERILKRGSETAESLALRLLESERELAMAPRYDYQVVNDDLQTAVQEMEYIIRCEKEKRSILEEAAP